MYEVSKSTDELAIRKQFPSLSQKINGRDLIYLDNAATSQKPQTVIESLGNYYEWNNANIHRGIHSLAERATFGYEATRKSVKKFINASEHEEIIFTKGTTEGINLVSQSYGRKFLGKDDEIIISHLEHHSNIVPWQILCEQTGAKLKVIPISSAGEIIMEEYYKLLSNKCKIVSVSYISNSLGTINNVTEIISKAHEHGALVMIDAAQAAPHVKIDVQGLDVDFLAFSSHKMYGPTGVGVLYGKRHILEIMDPYQGGGEMIDQVSFKKTTYNNIPYKFEAGTPPIAGVIAFNEEIKFITDLGHGTIARHENQLLDYANYKLQQVDGFTPIGTAEKKTAVISFNLDGIHDFDLSILLDSKGIAVRNGHHCTQPIMDYFNIEGTVRASFAVYNTSEEIDILADALVNIRKKIVT